MPFTSTKSKRTGNASDKHSTNTVTCPTQKARRLKTLVKKVSEISRLFGLDLNLLVYDKRFNKISENSTCEHIKLSNLIKMVQDSQSLTQGTTRSGRTRKLRIVSYNAHTRYQKGKQLDCKVEEKDQTIEPKNVNR